MTWPGGHIELAGCYD